MSIKKFIPGKVSIGKLEWQFCSEWYEDHRKVRLTTLKKFSILYPYKGLAYRASDENNFGVKTSWSKDLDGAKKFGSNIKKEYVSGIDLEAVAAKALVYQPKDIEMHEIVEIREVIKL